MCCIRIGVDTFHLVEHDALRKVSSVLLARDQVEKRSAGLCGL